MFCSAYGMISPRIQTPPAAASALVLVGRIRGAHVRIGRTCNSYTRQQFTSSRLPTHGSPSVCVSFLPPTDVSIIPSQEDMRQGRDEKMREGEEALCEYVSPPSLHSVCLFESHTATHLLDILWMLPHVSHSRLHVSLMYSSTLL